MRDKLHGLPSDSLRREVHVQNKLLPVRQFAHPVPVDIVHAKRVQPGRGAVGIELGHVAMQRGIGEVWQRRKPDIGLRVALAEEADLVQFLTVDGK